MEVVLIEGVVFFQCHNLAQNKIGQIQTVSSPISLQGNRKITQLYLLPPLTQFCFECLMIYYDISVAKKAALIREKGE